MTGNRLSKESLLRKSSEYRLVYNNGRRLRGKGFTLVYTANRTDSSRLGISIHRKLRGAVRRNRIKRMIREVFRVHRDLFPHSCDIVFTVSPHFDLPTSESIRAAVAEIVPKKVRQE